MNAAQASREAKEGKYPHHYCTYRRCLWRTYDARTDKSTPCGNHGPKYLHPDAPNPEVTNA